MAFCRAYRRGPSRSRPLVRLHRPLPYHTIPYNAGNCLRLDWPRASLPRTPSCLYPELCYAIVYTVHCPKPPLKIGSLILDVFSDILDMFLLCHIFQMWRLSLSDDFVYVFKYPLCVRVANKFDLGSFPGGVGCTTAERVCVCVCVWGGGGDTVPFEPLALLQESGDIA